jgi:hypothetical protein
MFGSYTLNNPRKNVTPSLSIKTQSTIIEFYRCSIKMIRNEEVDTLFDEEVERQKSVGADLESAR